MAFEYVDRTIEFLREMEPLDDKELLTGSNQSGSTIVVRYLGPIRSSDLVKDAAVKLPRLPQARDYMDVRVIADVAQTSLLYDRVPEYRDRLPYFTGLITVAGADAAVITEDVSDCGAIPLWSQPVDPDIRQRLAEVFAEQGTLEQVFRLETLESSLEFKAGDTTY